MQGNITGRLSSDKKKRESLQRQGIQPYSIKLGDKYISYQSYEPLSSWLALIANNAEVLKEKNGIGENKTIEIVTETVKMMKDQSFLQGLSDLTNALEDPERYGNKWTQNMVTSLVPTGIGYLSRLQDPIIREPGSIPESIRARLPGFSKGLPPKLDVWGRPITKEGTLWQRAMLPSGVMTSKPDLTEQELQSLELFPEKITKRYRGLDLTIQERNAITEVEGKIAKEYLDKIVQTPQYKNLQPYQQHDILNTVNIKIRNGIRTPFFQKESLNRLKKITDPIARKQFIEDITKKQLIKE